MADLLSTSSDWLQDQRHKHLARTVTYIRGPSSVELQATAGRTSFEVVDENGILQEHESRDWLVRAEDLVLDGLKIKPRPGDVVSETLGGVTHKYTVMSPGEGPP